MPQFAAFHRSHAHRGVSGVIWGSIIAQALVGLISSGIYISRFMRRFTL